MPAISEATFKKLSEAQELVEAKDYQGGLAVLSKLINNIERYNGNEKGQIYNMLGFVYYSMDDYKRATDAYSKVVAQGDDIPEGLEVTTLYTLAQLSFVNEQYNDALRYMQTWIEKAQNPGPDPYVFMAQVYYQMKQFGDATSMMERGISVAKERGTPIRENWWTLLNYLYFEQENWPKVTETLEILVRDFPKREYWIRLAGVHGQQGRDKKQISAYEAADVAGFPREGIRLHQLRGPADAGRGALSCCKGTGYGPEKRKAGAFGKKSEVSGPGLATLAGSRQGHPRTRGSCESRRGRQNL